MSSRKCQACGMVNFAGAEKCKRCGADLAAQPEQAAPAVAQSSPVASPALLPCPDCGGPVSMRARSCPHCGRPATRPLAGAVLSEALGVLLLIGAAVAGFSGVRTIFEPAQLVGGDAFNYIIAAGRGTGVIALGVGLALVGGVLLLLGTIQRYR